MILLLYSCETWPLSDIQGWILSFFFSFNFSESASCGNCRRYRPCVNDGDRFRIRVIIDRRRWAKSEMICSLRSQKQSKLHQTNNYFDIEISFGDASRKICIENQAREGLLDIPRSLPSIPSLSFPYLS